jgi:DNA polymerase III delta prime subunit
MMSLPQTLIIKKWRIVMTFENRHRAEVWSDLVFADPQVGLDLRQYAEGKAFNNILLHGPYGAAKSMTAKVLAAASYGKRLSEVVLDITEIQHDVDSRLQAFVDGGRYGYNAIVNQTFRPYAIMNEVDEFTREQQLKLRGIIDEQVNGRFIFTTNNLEKVDGGLMDRCDCYELEIPPANAIVSRAQAICRVEGIEIDEHTLQAMIAAVGGSIRQTLKALEKFVLEAKQ